MSLTSLRNRALRVVLRALPRRLLGRDASAALRAAGLPKPERDALARNLRRMLDPGRAV